MKPVTTPIFDLPGSLAAKSDPRLIAADERHFERIRSVLQQQIAESSERLDAERRAPARSGQRALDRDLEIQRLSSRVRMLRRFGLDVCLGRMDFADGSESVYVGRIGLTGDDSEPLLVDWRAPAAAPFFAATHADPMGLASRRRYRWTRGRITDYWDEVFAAEGLEGHAALDDQSAFIASLATSRSPRMRDVLGTIQADQDAIIRAGSSGALVVEGGPGTGKTVVALHRAAYLLYADPRLRRGGGGVLFVGPHEAYLDYVQDVLPSLGEEGVRLCTLPQLVPEGKRSGTEADPEVTQLKATADMVRAVDAAIRLYEQPPSEETVVETGWNEVVVTPDAWADAFAAVEPGTTHNEAREQIWTELVEILAVTAEGASPGELRQSAELFEALERAWPLLDPGGLVAGLWSSPGFLRRCAPWLAEHEVRLLQREDARAWTDADLPLLDAAHQLLGDPELVERRRRQRAQIASDRRRMSDVVDDLVASDDSEMLAMTMLRGDDFQNALIDEDALTAADVDPLAGPFSHIVVDEAQELTDAQWQMLLRRCPSRSFTIVGDRAQARHGFAGTWQERLERAGIWQVALAQLSINYRTPDEVMAEAEPVIRAALPDANVPTSIRSSGVPVRRGEVSELAGILEEWAAENAEGTACVIGDPSFAGTDRIRSLPAEGAKGLEFDLVVLVNPGCLGDGIAGAVDRYVAMTRATSRLVILGD